MGKSHFRGAHHQAMHSKVIGQNLVWYCAWSLHFLPCKAQVKMVTKAHTDARANKWMRSFALGLVNLHSCLLLPLIYIKCEWLLNRVEGLVLELGNSPFLKTQWNRGRTAYVGIWMVNRWITQSNVFLCRLAGIVLWYLCICARKSVRWGHGGVGIHPSP